MTGSNPPQGRDPQKPKRRPLDLGVTLAAIAVIVSAGQAYLSMQANQDNRREAFALSRIEACTNVLNETGRHLVPLLVRDAQDLINLPAERRTPPPTPEELLRSEGQVRSAAAVLRLVGPPALEQAGEELLESVGEATLISFGAPRYIVSSNSPIRPAPEMSLREALQNVANQREAFLDQCRQATGTFRG